MSEKDIYRNVISTGEGRMILGWIAVGIGVFAALAGSVAVSGFCFAVGSGLLFWAYMLRNLSALERKLTFLIGDPPKVAEETDPQAGE